MVRAPTIKGPRRADGSRVIVYVGGPFPAGAEATFYVEEVDAAGEVRAQHRVDAAGLKRFLDPSDAGRAVAFRREIREHDLRF